MTGRPQWRPAAGWLARRSTDALDALEARRSPRPAGVPPRRLRARVGAPGVAEYQAGGAAALAALEAALAPRGLVEGMVILDFGCGPGRVLAPLAARLAGTDLHGVDVDAEAIAWARAHLAGVDVRASSAVGRLPFPDASFDLVYSISVFSHLSATDQDAWLAEVARLLAPGGVALLSTHGPDAFAAFRDGRVRTAWCDPAAFARAPLGGEEMVTVPYRPSRWNRGDLRGVGDAYGLSFHGGDYIATHWGERLAIREIRPRAVADWQDLVVAEPLSTTSAST